MATKTKPKKKRGTIQYEWIGSNYSMSAQEVGEALADLEIKPGDCHRTADILDAARHPDSPMHSGFTWDDGEAAEKCRMSEARQLLRTIAYVVIEGDRVEKKPVYYHVTDGDGPRYVNADRVARDPAVKKSALDEALRLLNGIKRRFSFIQELRPVFEALDDVG